MHITKTGPVKNKPVQFRGHPNPYRKVGRPRFHISSFHGDLESGIGVPNSGMSETRKWFSLHTAPRPPRPKMRRQQCSDLLARQLVCRRLQLFALRCPPRLFRCLRPSARRAFSAVCAPEPAVLLPLFALRRPPRFFRCLRSGAPRSLSAVCAPAPPEPPPLFALRRPPRFFRCLRVRVRVRV